MMPSPIEAVFFSRFHSEKGPTVLHQVPEGSVVLSASQTAQQPLFDFSSVSDLIIPRQEFCGRLVSICASNHRVISFPICITDERKYDRNEFIFNFALVVHESTDPAPCQKLVRKVGQLFREVEQQSSFLSDDERLSEAFGHDQNGEWSGSRIYAICEMILEDMNNYGECMIPLNESNTLIMKLFSSSPPQVAVKPWHVPLSAAQLLSIDDDALDMTMQRIIPHIDGVSSVAAIAKRVDANADLACQAISHLFKQGYVLLTDIFQFSSVYVPTPQIRGLLFDEKMRDDYAKLVSIDQNRVDSELIMQLYTSLTYGQTLKNWCIDNWDSLASVDIRRFVTVGVLRGILHRVHKYPFSPQHSNTTKERPLALRTDRQEAEQLNRVAVHRSGEEDPGKQDATDLDSGALLDQYLDGTHCFDEICTTFGAHEKAILAKMRTSRDVHVIQK